MKFAILSLIAAASISSSYGIVSTYTSKAAFDGATAGFSDLSVNFDNHAAGTTISDGGSIDGVTFSFPVLAGIGLNLTIDNAYTTTSPNNYLATDDPDGLFQDGDDFSLSFGPVNAIGLYFITPEFLIDDDILLTVGNTTVNVSEFQIDSVLSDDSNVYFLGLVDTVNSFSSADIVTSNGGNGYFTYTVDDLTLRSSQSQNNPVSDSGNTALALLGAVSLITLARRQIRR